MNVLYSVVGRDFHEMVINKIKRELCVQNQVVISELCKVSKKNYSAVYEFSDVYFGRYYKYKENEFLEPVDDKLLEEMMSDALETIKMMDRPYTWKMGFEDRFQLYIKHLCFWNSVLDIYDIDCAIFFNVPHEVFDFVIYSLCKKKKIRTFTIFNVPRDFLKNRAFVSEDYLNEWKRIAECISEGDFGVDVSEPLAQYSKYYSFCTAINANTPEAKKNWINQSSSSDNIDLMCFYKIRMDVECKNRTLVDVNKVVEEIEEKLIERRYRGYRKKIRNELINENNARIEFYESLASEPVEGEKYVYYALHYQPEATSEPWGGGMFSNQLIPIRMICNCLPKEYKLYVKEHPSQTHIGRDNNLYKEIASIKNARLMSLKTDNINLIRSAVATATLTGTTAMESVLNGVPCLTFGKYIYNAMEGCYYVRTNEECKKALKKILLSDKIDQEKVKKFFCAVYSCSIPANNGYGSYDVIKNAEVISDELIRRIKE